MVQATFANRLQMRWGSMMAFSVPFHGFGTNPGRDLRRARPNAPGGHRGGVVWGVFCRAVGPPPQGGGAGPLPAWPAAGGLLQLLARGGSQRQGRVFERARQRSGDWPQFRFHYATDFLA